MNRILKRPMFRKGGSTNGIMTGLDTPRKRFSTGTTKTNPVIPGLDEESILNIGNVSKQVAEKIYPREKTDINEFLINFGLDLMSRPPQGGFLSTAATAAKAPTQQLYKDIKQQKAGRAELESGLFGALVKARGDALSGDGDNRLAKLVYEDRIKELTQQMIDNYEEYQKTGDYDSFYRVNQMIVNRMEPYSEYDLVLKAIYGDPEEISDKKKRIRKQIERDNPDAKQDEIALAAEVEKRFREQLVEEIFTSKTGIRFKKPEEKAEGGRIGYQNAGPVMPSAMPAPGIMSQAPQPMDQEPTEPSISYDELRARLPSEITDDIVRLISESPQALEDFATIQTQQDVNNFNTKYGVNLTLPPEA